MHRQPLLQLLNTHKPADSTEEAMLFQTIAFVTAQPDCFHRTLLSGHITGSAWIVSPDRTEAVLLHHRKLDRWFQPGGHADGDPDINNVALREAQEETGLVTLKLVSPAIFDVDVHTIPARGNEPEHLHYDIRFFFEATTTEPFIDTVETKGVKWVPLSEIEAFNNSESILRLSRKTKLV